MINLQQPEKQDLRDDGVLAVHSIFFTIQGEGPYTGQRAVFVRLAGCNLQCPMCDTDYTSERSWISPKQLMWEINAALPKDWEESPAGSHAQLVVITGGEPFRQNLRPAIEMLLESNYAVQIETNGTLYQDLPYEDITVVCSPKAGSINKNLAEHITALKYVVSATEVIGVLGADDGLPNNALNHPAAPRLARPPKSFQGPIYIQPADEQDEVKNHVNTNLAIDSVLKYGYVLQLQTHKIVDME